MERKFLIKDASRNNRDVGVLKYNTSTKEFELKILTGYPITDYPIILRLALEKGYTELPQEWVDIWVKERLIPPNRQNILSILTAAGLKTYDEFGMLMYTNGRCAQDYCFLEEITETPENKKTIKPTNFFN